MSTSSSQTANFSLDPAFIAEITRRVIARLDLKASTTATNISSGTVFVQDKVITADVVSQLGESVKEISVLPNAVITPAAKDELRSRGISVIIQDSCASTDAAAKNNRLPIVDHANPGRAISIAEQLTQRGVKSLGGATIYLSESPALDVIDQCQAGQRAVMIDCYWDVDRFAREAGANAFVFDMTRMNLVAAVNAAVCVSQLGVSLK